MIGNVTGNDTGNVSRTCNHIISNPVKLVNRNLVREVLYKRIVSLLFETRSNEIFCGIQKAQKESLPKFHRAGAGRLI